MYSKGYSENKRLYTETKRTDRESFSLPPRYSGVRFMKEKRSDGREGVFERMYIATPSELPPRERKHSAEREKENSVSISELQESTALRDGVSEDGCETVELEGDSLEKETFKEEQQHKSNTDKSIIRELFSSVGEDDLLIIALILILAGQKGENNRDVILLLAVLLCFR